MFLLVVMARAPIIELATIFSVIAMIRPFTVVVMARALLLALFTIFVVVVVAKALVTVF